MDWLTSQPNWWQLRVMMPSTDQDDSSLRIFDTPGTTKTCLSHPCSVLGTRNRALEHLNVFLNAYKDHTAVEEENSDVVEAILQMAPALEKSVVRLGTGNLDPPLYERESLIELADLVDKCPALPFYFALHNLGLDEEISHHFAQAIAYCEDFVKCALYLL